MNGVLSRGSTGSERAYDKEEYGVTVHGEDVGSGFVLRRIASSLRGWRAPSAAPAMVHRKMTRYLIIPSDESVMPVMVHNMTMAVMAKINVPRAVQMA